MNSWGLPSLLLLSCLFLFSVCLLPSSLLPFILPYLPFPPCSLLPLSFPPLPFSFFPSSSSSLHLMNTPHRLGFRYRHEESPSLSMLRVHGLEVSKNMKYREMCTRHPTFFLGCGIFTIHPQGSRNEEKEYAIVKETPSTLRFEWGLTLPWCTVLKEAHTGHSCWGQVLPAPSPALRREVRSSASLCFCFLVMQG